VKPTVVNAARVTTKDSAVWRECAGCGALRAFPRDVHHCAECQAAPVREYAVDVLLNLAATHTRGPAGAADAFDRLADAYIGLAKQQRGVQADELAGLAADLRTAARRLRKGRRWWS